MSDQSSPEMKRRQLAAMLRGSRHAAKMTIEQVAAHLLCSQAKVSRMETGQRPASPRDVRDLCDLYAVSPGDRDQMMILAQDGRQRSWWDEYDISKGYKSLIGMESDAVSMLDFKSSMINGLLQTEEYARELIGCYFLPVNRTLVDQLVTVRIERQRTVLERDPPPRMHFVMDEAVLRRVVGGPGVMEEQLGRLLAITAELPSVTIQVIPFRQGAHAGMDTSFTVLTFPDEKLMRPVIHVEDVFGDIKLERPEDLDRSQQIFQRAAQNALPPEQSRALIEEVRAEYERETPPEE